ncbi:uncharacterized protein ACRADG_001037 [Cochliomyia hominivorax]
MFKLVTYLIFTALLLRVFSLRLYGNKLKAAEVLLDRALARIIHEDGPIYSNRGVDAAYKFIPNIVYRYDTIVADYKNKEKACLIIISYAYTEHNALASVKCEGDVEVNRTIINEKILVPEEVKNSIK